MRARSTLCSLLAALTLTAAFAGCGESPPPPAKTADTAPAASTSAPATTAAPDMSSTPEAAPPGTAAAVTPEAPPAAPVPPGTFLYQKKAPAVGARVTETDSKTISMTITATPDKGKPAKVVRSSRDFVEKTVEVLAVSGDTITKVKASYKEHGEVENEDGKEKRTTAPVAGKTYIVESKGGSVTVTGDKGAAVTPEEAEAVKKDFKRLGEPDDMRSALPSTPLKVGDKVDSLAQALRERMARDDDGKTQATVEKSNITLSAVNEKGGVRTGVFDVTLDLVMNKDKLVIKFKMTGKVELRMDDGMPLSMSFQSPLTVSSAPGTKGIKITGSGLATFENARKPL